MHFGWSSYSVRNSPSLGFCFVFFAVSSSTWLAGEEPNLMSILNNIHGKHFMFCFSLFPLHLIRVRVCCTFSILMRMKKKKRFQLPIDVWPLNKRNLNKLHIEIKFIAWRISGYIIECRQTDGFIVITHYSDVEYYAFAITSTTNYFSGWFLLCRICRQHISSYSCVI